MHFFVILSKFSQFVIHALQDYIYAKKRRNMTVIFLAAKDFLGYTTFNRSSLKGAGYVSFVGKNFKKQQNAE